VSNRGSAAGSFTTDLVVDGDPAATETVQLGAGESGVVVFEQSFGEPGVYEVAIGPVPVGTLTVEANGTATGTRTRSATPFATATGAPDPVEVVNASSLYTWVQAGFEARVQATVRNTGDDIASHELTVTVDDDPVTTQTVTLDPGERQQVTFEFEAVEGTVAVDGVEAGRLRVGTPTDSNDDPTTGSGPGFGVVVVLAALAGLAVLGRHSRSDSE